MEVCIKWTVCRICLQQECKKSSAVDAKPMKRIFDDSRLAQQIADIAGITLLEQDGLPQKICRKCLEALKYGVHFRNTCRNSNEYLQNVMLQTKLATSMQKLDEKRETLEQIEEDLESLFSDNDDDSDEIMSKAVPTTTTTTCKQLKNNAENKVNNNTNSNNNNKLPANKKRQQQNCTLQTAADAYSNVSVTNALLPLQQQQKNSDDSNIDFAATDNDTRATAANMQTEQQLQQLEQMLKQSKSATAAVMEQMPKSTTTTRLKPNDINALEYAAAIYETAVDDNDDEEIVYLLPTAELKKEIIDEESIENDLYFDETNIERTDIELVQPNETTNVADEDMEFVIFDETAENSGMELMQNKKTTRTTMTRTRKLRTKTHEIQTTESRDVFCDLCGNNFQNRSMLSYHMRLHRNERKFECELCHKRFNASCNLTAHMRTHSGQKPFQCKTCHRSFADRSTHIKHERTHTSEKPYGCQVCGKYFALSTTLKAHTRVHSGEKPFSCLCCQKSFTLPHQLKAHEKTYTHALRVARGVKTNDFDST